MSFLLQFVQYCIKNGSKLTLLWRTLRRCSIRKLSSICDIFYLRNMNVQDNNIMHVEYHNTIYNNHLQARSIYCTWPICFSLTLRNISHILFLFSHPPPAPIPNCRRLAEQFFKFNKISYMGLNLTCNKAQSLQSIHPVSPVPIYIFSPLFLPPSSRKILPMNHANA